MYCHTCQRLITLLYINPVDLLMHVTTVAGMLKDLDNEHSERYGGEERGEERWELRQQKVIGYHDWKKT